MEIEGVKVGEKVCEGKTKQVYKIPDEPGQVLLVSKDRITAGDGARAHDMKGKAEISTATTCAMFELLSSSGIKTHFIRRNGNKSIKTYLCDMIPIEWVTRRVATGSFLKRNEGVKEGYRFCPPKQETFFKDDANNDPQWSYEQCVEAQITVGGVLIGPDEIDIMSKTTVTVFEILERYWASLDCSLIDMKIEFGVHPPTGEILLADVVDSDSWRLWPSGDKRLMKDKDVYRKMTEVTEEGLDLVKRNYEWVVDRLPMLTPKPRGRAVVLMGSATDMAHCEKIRTSCKAYGVPCELRVTSAHKGTMETMNILAKYEGDAVPTVFIAVAGRSNGLGPVLSGNATWPVINCPPVTADWGAEDIWSSLRLPSGRQNQVLFGNVTWPVINCPPVMADWGAEDIWSSLRLPSGLGCSTVMSPDGAALAASQILGLTDHVVWSKLRAKQLNTWVGLKLADKKSRNQ